jgi:guanidinoacetate N-methyltransferase
VDGGDFFRHWNGLRPTQTADGLRVGDYDVAYAWEAPLMREFARVVTEVGGDVLEIGFGLGMSARYIQEFGVRSHTIVEPHPEIFDAALRWKATHRSDIRLINDFWQRCHAELDRYDGIFYDSFSPDMSIRADSFEFFRLAAERLLRPGGRLTFWCKEETLAPDYQQQLLEYFGRLSIHAVRDLAPTDECRRRGFRTTMIVPVAWR